MTKNNKKGFTIIEVVLVLAIAGLIFLMVFIALPALQRSQRNTRRREDMARILSAINDYQTNNNWKVPIIINSDGQGEQRGDFVNKYIDETCNAGTKGSSWTWVTTYDFDCSGDKFRDPDGSVYSMAFAAPGYLSDSNGTGSHFVKWHHDEGFRREHRIILSAKSKCSGNENAPVLEANGEGEIALVYVLEGGAIYCGDNQ